MAVGATGLPGAHQARGVGVAADSRPVVVVGEPAAAGPAVGNRTSTVTPGLLGVAAGLAGDEGGFAIIDSARGSWAPVDKPAPCAIKSGDALMSALPRGCCRSSSSVVAPGKNAAVVTGSTCCGDSDNGTFAERPRSLSGGDTGTVAAPLLAVVAAAAASLVSRLRTPSVATCSRRGGRSGVPRSPCSCGPPMSRGWPKEPNSLLVAGAKHSSVSYCATCHCFKCLLVVPRTRC